jgi:hypothetical protein
VLGPKEGDPREKGSPCGYTDPPPPRTATSTFVRITLDDAPVVGLEVGWIVGVVDTRSGGARYLRSSKYRGTLPRVVLEGDKTAGSVFVLSVGAVGTSAVFWCGGSTDSS